MEIPDLVRESLGDEEIRAGVNLGDDDAVCFTPTRAIVYRGEGLLSDEDVSVYPLDFERLAVSEGRRKTKFTLTYVDSQEAFTVPGSRDSAVLERLIEGGLQVSGVIDDDESVSGVFRFSELTLVVAERRLVKHVGERVWDADFEVYPFADLTGLDFEEGSVATSVVLTVDGRPERIKAPNEDARAVRQALEETLFPYYEVSSLEELNATVGPDDAPQSDASDDSSGLGLDSGIDPLVDDGADESEADEAGDARGASTAGQSADGTATGQPTDGTTTGQSADETAARSSADSDPATDRSAESSVEAGGASNTASQSGVDSERPTGQNQSDEIAELRAQIAELSEAVEQQNDRLDKQRRAIEQLVDELRKR